MAIIACPGCGKRISDQYTACPHCDEVLGEMDPEEIERRAFRRRRRLFFRARMVTFVAMTLFMVGLLWWWVDGELMSLTMPPPLVATALMTVGVAVYLVAWGYIAWLRWSAGR